MFYTRSLIALASVMFVASPVISAVNVAFLEGAPKDRFVVTNAGSCDLETLNITLDLSTSESGVIFDVTGDGAGVEVYQPFEIGSGARYIDDTPEVSDGDRALTLRMNRLPAGQSVAFTIDVDDTRGGREITVTDGEISGATATVETSAWTVSEAFAETAELVVQIPACT